jgi:O-antigen/teichoic acid export membrane protein
MARLKRSVWNYASSVVLTGATLVLSFLSTPLLLRWLGDERFGAFRAATDWSGYLQLLELGLGGALMAQLARAVGGQDPQAIATRVAVGFRSYCRVCLLMLLIGTGMSLSITRLVPVGPQYADDLQSGFWLCLLSLSFVPFASFRYLSEASQRGYVVNLLLFVQMNLVILLALVFARLGWGIRGQFLAVVLGGIPFYGYLAWDGLRRYPGLAKALVAPPTDTAVRSELWKLSWPTLLFNLCSRLCLFTDNILIAYLLGPGAVAAFILTQRLASLAQTQLQGIGTASWAALVDLHVRQQHELFNRRLIELTRLVAVLGVAGLVPIAAYNRFFIHLWVGPDRFAGQGVTMVAALNAFLLGIISLWGWVFSGTGKVRVMVPVLAVGAVVNVTVSVLSTLAFGPVGPLLGTLVTYLSVSLWWLPLLLRREFQTELRTLFKAVAQPLLIGLPYGVGVWLVASSHQPVGWLGLGAELATCSLVYLLLWWRVGFSSEERHLWFARLRGFWPQRSFT